MASVRFNSPMDPPSPHSCYRRVALNDRFGEMVTSLRVISFNCRGFKSSQDDINLLAVQADIMLLQEHWLYKEEFGLLGRAGEAKFAYTAVSPMDSYQYHCSGRPFGGSAVLWRKSLQKSVLVVSRGSDRLSAIALNQGSSRILIVSVYLPYYNGSADQACAFDEQLAALDVMVHDTSYSSVMIMGDFNADLRLGFQRRFGYRLKAFLDSNGLSVGITRCAGF